MNAYFLDVVLHFTYRCSQISALPRTVYSRFIKKHKLFKIISDRIKVINIEFIGNIYFFPLIVTKTSFELSKNFKMYKFKRNVRRIYTFFYVCYIGNAGYVLLIFFSKVLTFISGMNHQMKHFYCLNIQTGLYWVYQCW